MRIRAVVFASLLLNPAVSQAAPVLQHSFSKIFGDANNQDARAVSVDPFGNVWITGMYRGTVNFGGGNIATVGNADDTAYLAKFNSGGTHLYSVGFDGGTTTSEYGTVIACDPSGNVFLAGQMSASINLGGGFLNSAGGTDIFLAKFNNAGVHQWSKKFGDASNQFPNGIAVDGGGNVYLTGFFQGTVDFGGGGLVSTGGSTDIFLARFDPSGNHVWSKRFGETGTQNVLGITITAAGDIGMTGPFAGQADFGGGALTSLGSNDIYIARFNSAGTHVWSKRFGDSATQSGNGIGFDPVGNVIVSGSFQGTVNFGGDGLTTAGGNDIYLAQLDAAGNHVWSKRFGDVSVQSPAGVRVDAGGGIVLSGHSQGTINFGGDDLITAGANDIFLARFDNDGDHIWSSRFGDLNEQQAVKPAIDSAGNPVIAGFINGTVDFGGGGLAASGQDIFVARYSRVYPEIHDIVDVPGDQGGWVRVFFQGSGQDFVGASPGVTTYYVQRRIDNMALVARIEREGTRIASGAIEWNERRFVRPPPANGLTAMPLWETVASVPGRQQATDYIALAPTQADSTSFSTALNTYFVMAQTTTPWIFYDSDPDSGYSVDNLAPGAPSNFTLQGNQLTWDESTANDFDYFTVYGSSSNSFASSIIINYSVTPMLDVSASPYAFYFVTATDFHDNEGQPAFLQAPTGVDDEPRRYVLSVSAYPNPFNPATTIRYTVPARGFVSVDVFDLLGARVVALVDGEKAAGAYVVIWNGRDSDGRAVSSGVYFVRIHHQTGTRSYKLVLLK